MGNKRTFLTALLLSLLRRRVVRFALVGGAGIPLNVGLLWLLHEEFHLPTVPAWIVAFELCVLINFYANQRFTYREQQHLRGWDWPKRALRAQLTTVVGIGVNVMTFGGLLAAHVPYLTADVAGIVAAFGVNFLLAQHFVFTPAVAAPVAPQLELSE